MGIEFRWGDFAKSLGEGIKETGHDVAGMLMKQYEEKREEERTRREIMLRHNLQVTEAERQEAQQKADQLEVFQEQEKIKFTYAKQVDDYKYGVEAALNSSGLLSAITADISSGDIMRQAMSAGVLRSINKLKSNEKLTPQDDILIAQYTSNDPIALSAISGIKMKNAEFNLQQKSTLAYANYMNSQGLMIGLRGKDQFTDTDIRGIENQISANEAQILSLQGDKNWLMISGNVDKISKQLVGMPPEAIQEELRKQLGPTQFSIYISTLNEMKRLSEKNKELNDLAGFAKEQRGYPGAGQSRIGPPKPEPQPQPEPSATATTEKHPGILEQIFGKAKKEIGEQGSRVKEKKAEKSIQKVRKEYNIPSDVKIHYASNVENLQKLKKLLGAEGSYVWFDGELFRLERRKKVLGLVKVTK